MRKILYCASTLSHIRNFHLPYLKAFHDQGYEVWVAANEEDSIPYADHVVSLPFAKSLLSPQIVKASFSARRLLTEKLLALSKWRFCYTAGKDSQFVYA